MNRQVTADQNFIRRVNTRTVMDRIRLDAPLSRAEVSARTGLNRSTVSSIVSELMDQGYIKETTLQDPKIGRPGMLLQFNPHYQICFNRSFRSLKCSTSSLAILRFCK